MKTYTRKPRERTVWPHKARRMWYWRRRVNGKRDFTRIGTFEELLTTAEGMQYA